MIELAEKTNLLQKNELELYLLESLLIQQHQPDLNVVGSSIPLLLFNT